MNKNPLLEKAFEYHVRGYSIMPLRRNKRPLLSSWVELQTKQWSDEDILTFWQKHPSTNIGIITGKISGITVVDIDTGKYEGDPTTALSAFPPTYTVRTPTGGYHLYYQYDERIQQTANTFPQFPHVDIRNDGGYVVAPPSFCDYVKNKNRVTGTYKVITESIMEAFPIDLFKTGSGRNNALTQICGKIVQITDPKDYDTVGWQMVLTANKQFKEPLPEKEVLSIFNSIVKRENKKDNPAKKIGLLKGEKGAPVVSAENVYRVLKEDAALADCVRFNVFTGLIECNYERGEFITYQRVDIIRIAAYLMRTYSFLSRIRNEIVEDAFIRRAHENRVSPPVDWLRALTWDGSARLDTWLTSTYHTPDDEYHRAVGANWMKGLVKRIVEPGCKFDYVLVIEGRQGIRKSTSLSVLGGDWYVETILAPDNKDFFMLFGGKAIVEFSEGETLSRTEAKRLKAIITITNDKYRVPYERSPQEFPRQCVFAMTTNQTEYLKDETGNRRWLPIKCEQMVDIDWLQANREQLYAEAYHRAITKRETLHEFPEEETMAQQQMRQAADPREEMIYEWYFLRLTPSQRSEGVTTNQAYEQGVHKGVPFGREMSRYDAMVIGSILTDGLKLAKRRTMINRDRYYKYFPTPDTDALAPRSHELTPEMEAELMFTNYHKK